MKNKFMLSFLTLIATVTLLALSAIRVVAAAPEAPTAPVVGEAVAVLTQAPNVPPPIKRTPPTKVIVTLEVKEVVLRLADGVDYLFWTFGGEVPGSFIRVREGDFIEFHLNNNWRRHRPTPRRIAEADTDGCPRDVFANLDLNQSRCCSFHSSSKQ